MRFHCECKLHAMLQLIRCRLVESISVTRALLWPCHSISEPHKCRDFNLIVLQTSMMQQAMTCVHACLILSCKGLSIMTA